MRYIAISVLLVASFAVLTRADSPHQQSNTPANAPRELVMPVTGSTVLRVDKYTGETWYLGGNGYKGNKAAPAWNPLPLVEGAGRRGELAEWQVYAQSDGVVYLFNAVSGKTWILDAAGARPTWNFIAEIAR
jgi:hypothetical protein